MKVPAPFSVSIVSADKAPPGSIKEGSEVFVRVLSREGPGRYTVSFAGQRFSVASRRVLEQGAAFKARVRVEGGRVLLEPCGMVPRGEKGSFIQNRPGVTRFSSFAADNSGSLTALLHELGLPADSLSFRVLSFFQESSVQFNKTAALKARFFAKRFPGKEAAAAEAALLLMEKGFEPDEAVVAEILELFYGEYREGGGKEPSAERETFGQGEKNGEAPSLIGSLYEDAACCLSLPSGLLSFLNQYKTGDKHWVFLPFDYHNRDFNVNGVIRLLFDLGQKRVEKTVISAFSLVKDYFFVIYYNIYPVCSKEGQTDIDFCINPPPPLLRIKDFERFLYGVLPANCRVQYKPDLFDTGGTGTHCFSRVEEKA
ncbi:hypothetical protein V1L52_03580 [Treponema sp. HNW]|uniref:hypothetical protein n=1 Tax=Treponema sp. HNW TaxID=3116654 RepID=UPI003D152F07